MRCGRRSLRGLVDALLPPLCPGCRAEIGGERWLCAACRRTIRPAPSGSICFECRAAHRPRGDREAGYGCTRTEHRDLLGRAGWWMEPPLDAVIHAFKYEGRADLAPALGRLLAGRVEGLGEALVIAVPLHRSRRRERGYNQAQLLAEEAARRWGLPLSAEVMRRRRATDVQARLPESRRGRNVAGAFEVLEPAWVLGRSWVLVDDVTTTGCTLLEAAGALRAAGARRVLPVALALA
jgi:ComF family protein